MSANGDFHQTSGHLFAQNPRQTIFGIPELMDVSSRDRNRACFGANSKCAVIQKYEEKLCVTRNDTGYKLHNIPVVPDQSLKPLVPRQPIWVNDNGSTFLANDSLTNFQCSTKLPWTPSKNPYDYAEYSKYIYNYLGEAEIRYQPRSTYLRNHSHVNLEMRSFLVDWLVGITEEYKIPTEALYLAVSVMDRFLSVTPVLRSSLQLVGTASMFIAAKYEETHRFTTKEFIHITGGTHGKKQIHHTERAILTALNFTINAPTIYCFLQYMCCATEVAKDVHFLAQYLCELTLLEDLPFLPSQIAAGAISLSRYTLGYDSWDAELEHTTGYELQDLDDVIDCLCLTYRSASLSRHQTIREKYNGKAYNCVSSIPPPKKLSLVYV